MPKNLNTLAGSTDRGRKNRSGQVKTKHFKTLINKKMNLIREYHYWTGTGEFKYKTTIRPLNPMQYDLNNGNAPALVSCSCPDFKYRLEYSLSLSNNAKIKYSNGQPAVVTNPTNKKFLCKHLFAILPDVIKKNSVNVKEFEKKKRQGPLGDVSKPIIRQQDKPIIDLGELKFKI